jgi:hypothetical protein
MTMTELILDPQSRATAAAQTPGQVGAAAQAALITEQQVRLGSAAAVAVPPEKTRPWADAVESVARAMRAWFAGSREPARRHYPRRHAFLENALMSREMFRL